MMSDEPPIDPAVCEFCLRPGRWMYLCAEMTLSPEAFNHAWADAMMMLVPDTSCPPRPWAVCAQCADAVEKNDADSIVEHSMAFAPDRYTGTEPWLTNYFTLWLKHRVPGRVELVPATFYEMLAHPPISHHCRTCMRPLEFYIDFLAGSAAVRWQHITLDPNGPLPFEHDADPIPDVETLSPELIEGVCDFCCAPKPRWGYRADNFKIVEVIGPDDKPTAYGSAGAWAACDDCADLIDADDYHGILERAMALNPSAGQARTAAEQAQRRQGLAAMFVLFRNGRTSDRLPVEEA